MITKIDVKDVSPLSDKPDGPSVFSYRRAVKAGVTVTALQMWDVRYPELERHAREKVLNRVAMDLYGGLYKDLRELRILAVKMRFAAGTCLLPDAYDAVEKKISEMNGKIEALWKGPKE